VSTQFTGYVSSESIIETFRLVAKQSGKTMTACYDEALIEWIKKNKGENITLVLEPRANEDLVALASIVYEMLKNREE